MLPIQQVLTLSMNLNTHIFHACNSLEFPFLHFQCPQSCIYHMARSPWGPDVADFCTSPPFQATRNADLGRGPRCPPSFSSRAALAPLSNRLLGTPESPHTPAAATNKLKLARRPTTSLLPSKIPIQGPDFHARVWSTGTLLDSNIPLHALQCVLLLSRLSLQFQKSLDATGGEW